MVIFAVVPVVAVIMRNASFVVYYQIHRKLNNYIIIIETNELMIHFFVTSL